MRKKLAKVLLLSFVSTPLAEFAAAQDPLRLPPIRRWESDLLDRNRNAAERKMPQVVDPGDTPLLQLDPSVLLRNELPRGYEGVNRNLRIFQGFPNYPPSWPGFGGYPMGEGMPMPYDGIERTPSLPRSLPPRPDDWPSWFSRSARAGEGAFLPDMALLVRSSDRVWFKAHDEVVFVPLTFYDKGRVLRVGAEVEVRHKGDYELHFHGGAYLRSRGPCRVEVQSLTANGNELKIDNYYEAWLVTRLLPLRASLPNGAVVEVQGNSMLRLQQENGIGILTHTGEGSVTYQSEVGAVDIPHAHRVRFFLKPKTSPLMSLSLQLDSGLRTERDGRVLTVNGGESGGTLIWGGIRISLQPGQVLRLDPLAGGGFPENNPKSND
ncbi:MAG: hypothetical protein ACYTG5_14090 [Planctomycetota bacterium]|jgi:hypothetical protein